jgi:septal ring factor EnvC (AmiA/AmiB activator)
LRAYDWCMTAEITNQDIFEALTDFAIRTEERFEAIDRRLDAVDQRLDAVDRRFELIDQRFDQIDLRLSAVEVQIRSMAYELREINANNENHDGRITAAENDIKDIFFHLPAQGSTS